VTFREIGQTEEELSLERECGFGYGILKYLWDTQIKVI
jgi:hypothetical protein